MPMNVMRRNDDAMKYKCLYYTTYTKISCITLPLTSVSLKGLPCD
jgi:hypothetical protein